jgi:hypothetical protein
MLRKVVVSVLLIGLVALLVVGAVNRTLARTALESGQQTGRGASTQVSTGEGGGRTKGDLANAAQASRGQGRGEREPAALTDVTPVDWQTLTGVVTHIDGDALVLTLDTGKDALIEGQPWRYAQSQGFVATPGTLVTLAGYFEADEFKTGVLTNAVTGMSIQLRNASGRPAWSGQGERQQTNLSNP